MIPRSSVVGVVWPALTDVATSAQLALQWQLEQSQWWSPDELAAQQLVQLEHVWRHARATVPHYAGIHADDWERVPVLTRAALIAAGGALLSKAYPATHGPVEDVFSSRTSGEAVRVKSTGIVRALWAALTLREHLWHRRDLRAKLCVIRYTGDDAPPPDGLRTQGWGVATVALAPDAPMSVLSVKSTTAQQVAWLERERPDYLLVYPTVLDAIVRAGLTLPGLREVRTISEALSPETRALVAERWGVKLTDTYSAQEVGYLGMSCPAGAGYHVPAERLLVEILRDDGQPCRAGEVGRVIVTDLHNFATPLLRYDLGDHAEVGGPCPCGRGLPVLTRILGRRRGMLRYPDGRTVWPVFAVACRAAAPFRELQLVQESVDAIRVRIESDVRLTAAHHVALTDALRRCFDHPFAITVEQVDDLGRSPGGKREEFVSLVATG